MASRHAIFAGVDLHEFHTSFVQYLQQCVFPTPRFGGGNIFVKEVITMRWDTRKAVLSLTARDLAVMKQCRMGVGELVGRASANPALPPLWSVLSYVLFVNQNSSPARVWQEYRELNRLARQRDRWYYTARIPKNTGEMRSLRIPSFTLAWQQARIGRAILDKLPVSPYACAYRKGYRLLDCAAPHTGKAVLVHLDIRDFFGSIREEMVFEALVRETGYPKGLVRFLTRLCCFRGRLPQGACTSPALSNIVFRLCDDALAQLARHMGLEYTRYSDDLFFSGGSNTDTAALIGQVRKILTQHGFFLNSKKTKILRRDRCQRVVGIVVNEKPQVSRKYRRELLQELYYQEKFGADCYAAREAGDYGTYLNRLRGKVAYVLQVDPENRTFQEAGSRLSRQIAAYREVYPR